MGMPVALCTLLMTLAVCGCAGYRLGSAPGVIPSGATVAVLPLTNSTMEPYLGEKVTAALRKALQRDGTFVLENPGRARYEIRGELVGFQRQPVSYSRADVLTPVDYQLRVSAKVSVVDAETGRVCWDGVVSGATLMRVGVDFSASERRALDQLAEDLGRKLAVRFSEGEW